MFGILTEAEAAQAAELLATCDGTDQVHAAMIAEAKAERGNRWTPEHAEDLLRARVQLDAILERAGAGA